MPKVSIIIPIYNVEKYLEKCLTSIVNQTFRDIEIICVNDGSLDNSIDILKKYEKVDNRIKVITKENGGLFSARHEGMKYVNGEYVIFVDSDDWVERNLIEICINETYPDLPDIVVFGAYSVRETDGKISCKKGGYDYKKIPAKYRKNAFNKNIFKKDIFKFPPTAWSKMYRTDFLKKYNIKFQNIKNGEDQLFFIHSMLCADKIKVANNNLYYYIKSRAGAITSVSKKTSLSPILNLYAIDDLLNSLNVAYDYKCFILSKYLKKSISWYSKASDEIQEEFFKELKELQNYLIKKYPEYWWNNLNISYNDTYLKLKLNIALAQMIGAIK